MIWGAERGNTGLPDRFEATDLIYKLDWVYQVKVQKLPTEAERAKQWNRFRKQIDKQAA